MFALVSFSLFGLLATIGFNFLAVVFLAATLFFAFFQDDSDKTLKNKDYFYLSMTSILVTLILFFTGSFIFALISGALSYKFISESTLFKSFVKNLKLKEKIKRYKEEENQRF